MEDDNIYIYREENDPDDTPENYSSETNQKDEEINENPGKCKYPFRLMLKVMFAPVQGWKTLRREAATPEFFQTGCFYPLLALLALSQFADFFYSSRITLSSVITAGVIAFVSYFFGYFSVLSFLRIVFPKEIGEYFENNYGKVYIMLSMSTLVLFSIFTNLLPMLWPVLIFLPLWTIYIMYRGIRFFKLPESYTLKFTIFSCVSVIGFPLLIDWALNALLPN
ncbi:MAG: hypothetical protein J1E95_10020 [Muribaculaceae bacterium]|nr:hypothetical protein [Muribaculaceae bacterium]